LKLIISAGIKKVFYETSFNSGNNLIVRDAFIQDNLVSLTQIELSSEIAQKAALFLTNPTSLSI
jgi:dCMP deaminase